MRKFNKKVYDLFDKPCKIATVKIMNKKGYYLIDDIDTEHFKKFDLQFINDYNKILKIENEYRGPFNKIKYIYNSVHIPVRKKNTECDFYFIWGNNYKDLAIIDRKTFIEFRDNIVTVTCAKGKPYEFNEDFIDIPINKVKFFTFL